LRLKKFIKIHFNFLTGFGEKVLKGNLLFVAKLAN
jgi:hypothetical protein